MPKKAIQEQAAPEVLADIFKQAGDKAGLARSIVKAMCFARNDYENRLIMLALEQYASDMDKT